MGGNESHGRDEGDEGYEEESSKQDAKGRMAKVLVFRGSKEKTVGGMTASSLTKNKSGRVVSKKRSAMGKKNSWMIAVQKARKALKITGFVPIKKGSELYKKAKEFC